MELYFCKWAARSPGRVDWNIIGLIQFPFQQSLAKKTHKLNWNSISISERIRIIGGAIQFQQPNRRPFFRKRNEKEI